MVGRLDRIANGKRRQAAGLDFQTYVQRRYFHAIIQEANLEAGAHVQTGNST